MRIRRDRFGLSIGSLGETPDEKARRCAEIEAAVPALFKTVAAHLGEDKARVLFENVARRKRGRPRRSRSPERDDHLLRMYDAFAPDNRLIGALAERLDRQFPGEFGNSAPAIEKRLRRLIDRRRKEAAEDAAAYGRFPGLLGKAFETG